MRDVVSIRLTDIEKRFGDVKAVDHVTLTFEPGKLYVLLGPSGCGKTTTLRIVAGLEEPTAGRVHIGEEDVTEVPVYERDLGFVFQQYALFPHMSVAENIGFGLRMRRVGPTETASRVEAGLSLVQLQGLGDRRIRQLSGGQQQRVALARALVTEPRALLLDEPLSNLDKNLRDEMRSQIREIQRRLGITTIMVTHDQTEALSMADEIVVMNGGNVEQVGTPEAVYRRPQTLFTAKFVGAANIVEGSIDAEGRLRDEYGIGFPLPTDRPTSGDRFALMIRPSDISVKPASDSGARLAGTIIDQAYFGATRRIVVRLVEGRELFVDANDSDSSFVAQGDRVELEYAPDATHLLPVQAADG